MLGHLLWLVTFIEYFFFWPEESGSENNNIFLHVNFSSCRMSRSPCRIWSPQPPQSHKPITCNKLNIYSLEAASIFTGKMLAQGPRSDAQHPTPHMRFIETEKGQGFLTMLQPSREDMPWPLFSNKATPLSLSLLHFFKTEFLCVDLAVL